MKNLIIRNIEGKDIPQVVDIQIDGWQTAYRGIIEDEFLDSMDRKTRIEKRKKDYKENSFIVAEYQNRVIGFCRYIDSNKLSNDLEDVDCELLALYVKSDLKRNGVGSKLFKYVINEFQQLGKNKMILWCLKENEPSKKFYKEMGGKIIKERFIKIDNKEYLEVGFLYNL